MNRIDNVIEFNRLRESDIDKIVKVGLDELKYKYSNIEFEYSDNLVNDIYAKDEKGRFKTLNFYKLTKNPFV